MRLVKHWVCFTLALSFSGVLYGSDVQSEANLKVKRVLPGEGGIFITFDPQPNSCAGTYKSTHGFVSQNHALFDEIYASVSMMKTLKEPVTVHYVDRGDCNTAMTTLDVMAVE